MSEEVLGSATARYALSALSLVLAAEYTRTGRSSECGLLQRVAAMLPFF